MATNSQIAEAEFVAEQGFDANDPEQVNNARVKAGRKKKKNLQVVEAIMQHPDSREWFYRLLTACDVFRNSYVFGEPAEGMAFREGKRYIGLQLLADIRKASPENFCKMLDECDDRKLPPLFPPSGLD